MSFYSNFAEHYEAVFPFEEEVHAFLRGLIPEGARRVLDVGCGTGDYCGRFHRDGLEAVGADLDPWMIARARKLNPGPVYHEMGHELVSTFLSDTRGLLAAGGRWALQTVNWDFILGLDSYMFPDIAIAGGELVFEREYPSISEKRVVFSTRLRRGDLAVFEGETTLFPLRSEIYTELHEAAGFRLAGHYGSFGGAVFDARSPSSNVFAFEAV